MEPQPDGAMNRFKALTRVFRAWIQGPAGLALVFGGLAVVAGVLLVGMVWMTSRPSDEPVEVVEGIFFAIATGSVTGTYYPLGNVVASVIANPAGSVRCADEARCGPPGLTPAVQAAEGSVSNIEAVHDGLSASAFAQADVVSLAYNGDPPFETPYTDLRAISGLYGESLHLIVMRGSDIQSIGDLRGRRISVDRRGSGTFGVATRVLTALGLSAANTELVFERSERSAEMLLAGEIDGFFYVAGPPVRVVQDLTNLNLVKLVPIDGPEINALVAREPYLTAALIPEGVYLDIPEVRTIGVTAVWIVRDDAPFELVYRITRALWNPVNRAMLEAGPEQARILSPRDAIEGVPIPFHPGAEQYYLEVGLLTSE
jgi:TRAP transporter TAXI family solute receptor